MALPHDHQLAGQLEQAHTQEGEGAGEWSGKDRGSSDKEERSMWSWDKE